MVTPSFDGWRPPSGLWIFCTDSCRLHNGCGLLLVRNVDLGLANVGVCVCRVNPPRPQAQASWGLAQVPSTYLTYLSKVWTHPLFCVHFPHPPPDPPSFYLPFSAAVFALFCPPCPPPFASPTSPTSFRPFCCPSVPCPPPSHFCIHSALSHYRSAGLRQAKAGVASKLFTQHDACRQSQKGRYK